MKNLNHDVESIFAGLEAEDIRYVQEKYDGTWSPFSLLQDRFDANELLPALTYEADGETISDDSCTYANQVTEMFNTCFIKRYLKKGRKLA